MIEETLEEVRSCSSALLGDAMNGEGVFPAYIGAQTSTSSLTGVAYTIEMAAGDNLGLHVAIARASAGMVIVAKWTSEAEYGAWGSVLTAAAQEANLAGFVTDGWIRDSEEIEATGFPVFARGTCPRKTGKHEPGIHGEPIVLGEAVVNTGDIVRGDADGLVVVPRAQVGEVIRRARAIEARELEIMRGIGEGKTTVELLGLADPSPVAGGTASVQEDG